MEWLTDSVTDAPVRPPASAIALIKRKSSQERLFMPDS